MAWLNKGFKLCSSDEGPSKGPEVRRATQQTPFARKRPQCLSSDESEHVYTVSNNSQHVKLLFNI